MSNSNEITAVMFRKERNGDILAVFPYESWKCNYDVLCYAHLGQHAACRWEYVTSNTKPAKPEEYKSLYDELVSIGYQLRIIKRACHDKMYQL